MSTKIVYNYIKFVPYDKTKIDCIRIKLWDKEEKEDGHKLNQCSEINTSTTHHQYQKPLPCSDMQIFDFNVLWWFRSSNYFIWAPNHYNNLNHPAKSARNGESSATWETKSLKTKRFNWYHGAFHSPTIVIRSFWRNIRKMQRYQVNQSAEIFVLFKYYTTYTIVNKIPCCPKTFRRLTIETKY